MKIYVSGEKMQVSRASGEKTLRFGEPWCLHNRKQEPGHVRPLEAQYVSFFDDRRTDTRAGYEKEKVSLKRHDLEAELLHD